MRMIRADVLIFVFIVMMALFLYNVEVLEIDSLNVALTYATAVVAFVFFGWKLVIFLYKYINSREG